MTGLNNLFLAREHILQWKPSLVIADLHGFRQDTPHFQQFSSLLNASEKLPFIMLQSGEDRDMTARLENFPVWSSLMKNARLEELATVINEALISGSDTHRPTVATPLLTRRGGESADNVDGRRKQSKIAAHLSINGKTVYTYKRNIRMKLHMDTRFSPFLSPQGTEN